MADLKKLSRRIAATKAKKPVVVGPVIEPDVEPERIVSEMKSQLLPEISGWVTRIETALKSLIAKDTVIKIDASEIGKAVGKEIAKMPKQKIVIPVREPVSYRATIERRGKEMIGALIEPIVK